MASDDKFKMASDAVKSKAPLVTRFGQIVIGPPGKDGQQGGGGGSGRIHYFWRGEGMHYYPILVSGIKLNIKDMCRKSKKFT